ncbi:MAG TPA: TIR domain-containing protein [Pseudomonadales bacterium]
MADIFISYARSTRRQAEAIGEALVELGYSIWRDDALPAHRAYADEIQKQLNIAKAVVVVWSADAIKSDWVRSEADRARNDRKLVQLTVDGAALPMPFDQIQCANLAGWRGEGRAAGWATVLESIRALTDTAGKESPVSAGTQSQQQPEPILAVLPFDNLSTDPEMQFFSDGVSEEIIQRLSRGASLKVIGRTSSFQFRGERKAEAASALGCSHILDGSVRRGAGRMRLSAHLVETSSGTTLWSERYDRSLEDVFAVQDDVSENIAGALHHTFQSFSTPAVDPGAYDLYLRASPESYAPEEMRTNIGLLEVATQRAPDFPEAWGRLAYLRAFLRFYEPFPGRGASAAIIARESAHALQADPENGDALAARAFVVAPFGNFIELDTAVERLRSAPGDFDARKFAGWLLRNFGRVRESLAEDERAYLGNALDPMCANTLALARLAAGRVAEALPVLENLVERVPDMVFPFANLLRAQALLENWEALDELLELNADRPLREFQDTLDFIRTKRNPSAENIAVWKSQFEAHIARTGCIDISRVVYAAHLGLVDEAYQATEQAHLGPTGTNEDVMGPDGYRTSLLFQAAMPELRNDPRFVPLCARLGLVEFWTSTGKWPDCADEVPYDFRAACEDARGIPKLEFGF